MRLDLAPGLVVVTLSERNLLALLHKLQSPLSAGALIGGYVYAEGELVDTVRFVVVAESSEQHYADREPPGTMHPSTEEWLAERPLPGPAGAR
jgi:hypothetical protein